MEREKAFEEVQGMSVVDPNILDTAAYFIIEDDWLKETTVGPEYCCDICLQWCCKSNMLKLKTSNYDQEILDRCYKDVYIQKNPEKFERCFNGKQEWICKTCHKYFLKSKMPPRSQANSLELDPIVDVFLEQADKELYPIELMLISQIIPFMFITAKHTSKQWGLKGQCVLVLADLKKVQTSLPRTCNDDHLIALALKWHLSDRGYVDTQVIRPGLVNRVFDKLIEVNPLYQNTQINLSWENVSQESNPELCNILTDQNHKCVEGEIDDNDEEIEENDHAYEKEVEDSVLPLPTVLLNIEGPSSPAQVLNIAPGEGQITVTFTTEPYWEALAFPKDFPYGRFHFGDNTREVPTTPSQYIHARLKCFDNRFSKNPIYNGLY